MTKLGDSVTWEEVMPEAISVADAKRRFSELLGRTAYNNERFVIERHGKPVAAIVSPADLERLVNGTPPRGLLAAVGAMADVEDFEEIMRDVVARRGEERGREVDLE